jgi:hypothetical protein
VFVSTAAGNVALGAYWVTQQAMNDFGAATSAAQSILDSAAAQAELDSGVTALQGAMTAFSAARQEGTNGTDSGGVFTLTGIPSTYIWKVCTSIRKRPSSRLPKL